MKNRIVANTSILILIMLMMMGKGYAQEIEVPAIVQFEIFSKVLTYDKSLREHEDNYLTFAILYQHDVKVSDAIHNEMLEAIKKCELKEIKNLHFRFISVDLATENDLDEIIAKSNIDVMYISPLRAFDVQTILKLSRAHGILTMTGVKEYIEAGVSVGIGLKKNHPQIIINLPQVKAEGSDFSSRLLKLAKIIK